MMAGRRTGASVLDTSLRCDLRASLLRQRQPGAADLTEQAAHFVQPLGFVGRARLHEARAHVFVERVEVVGYLAAGLEVEAVAQLVDDRDRAVQELRLLGAAAVGHEAARRRDAFERTVHQHHDQAMRVRGRDAGVDRRAAISGEF